MKYWNTQFDSVCLESIFCFFFFLQQFAKEFWIACLDAIWFHQAFRLFASRINVEFNLLLSYDIHIMRKKLRSSNLGQNAQKTSIIRRICAHFHGGHSRKCQDISISFSWERQTKNDYFCQTSCWHMLHSMRVAIARKILYFILLFKSARFMSCHSDFYETTDEKKKRKNYIYHSISQEHSFVIIIKWCRTLFILLSLLINWKIVMFFIFFFV